MRWSRPQADTPLAELMEGHPDESAPSALPSGDDDTSVRAPLADEANEPGSSQQAPTSSDPADLDGSTPSDSFLDDEDYLPMERRGPGRLTVALVAALVLAVGVLGGVWVQKQLGTTASASGFGAGQGGPGAGSGTGGGTGTRGYGGAGTGAGTGGAGTAPGGTAPGGTAQGGTAGGDPSTDAGGGASGGTEAGTSTSGSGTAATPAVVGSVTTAGKESLVVTDLGGTKHTVTLTATTTVTTSYTHGALKAGDTVAVAGSAGTDGSVAATGITVS